MKISRESIIRQPPRQAIQDALRTPFLWLIAFIAGLSEARFLALDWYFLVPLWLLTTVGLAALFALWARWMVARAASPPS